MLLWSSVVLIGISTFIITSMIFLDEDQYKAQEKLEDSESSGKKEEVGHGIVLKYSRPFFRRYISPVVASMKYKKKFKEKYRRPLATAGLNDYMSPEDFVAFKIFLIFAFPVLFLFLKEFGQFDWQVNKVPFVAIFGFFYPDIWMRGKISQRQKTIIREMPFSVDMLALSVEAGLDFIAAMSKVVQKAKSGPLKTEFEILLREIKIGASRAEALRNMGWRINLIQVSSFCATLIAADSVGASIGPILKALSGEIRQKRSSDAEKAGATAATKILFPMMVFIVPAVMIIVFAPLVVDLVNGGAN